MAWVMFLEETAGGNSMFGRILGAIFLIAKNDPNDWFGGSKAGLKHGKGSGESRLRGSKGGVTLNKANLQKNREDGYHPPKKKQ